MWIIGMIVLLIAGAALTVALGWTPRAAPGQPLWDIAKSSSSNAATVGTLAGFSLTSAIFVAGLDAAHTAPAFATVFGMMLVGFLDLVVASWIAGSTPSAPHSDATTQSLDLVLENLCSTLGMAMTWLALAPLMAVIGLQALAQVFIWPLLFMTLASGAWVALIVHRVTMARAPACLAIPVVGLALPALYRLVAVPRWPALWPVGEAALHFAFVALGAAAIFFLLHLGLLIAHGGTEAQQRLRQDGHRLALAASQVCVLVVGLTWFAVALP